MVCTESANAGTLSKQIGEKGVGTRDARQMLSLR